MNTEQHEVPPANDIKIVKAITEMNEICVSLGTMDVMKCLSVLFANTLTHYPKDERNLIMIKFNAATLGIVGDMEEEFKNQKSKH